MRQMQIPSALLRHSRWEHKIGNALHRHPIWMRKHTHEHTSCSDRLGKPFMRVTPITHIFMRVPSLGKAFSTTQVYTVRYAPHHFTCMDGQSSYSLPSDEWIPLFPMSPPPPPHSSQRLCMAAWRNTPSKRRMR
eukprot:jgi/Botrbrau1/12943/Bobra.154_2s0005.1